MSESLMPQLLTVDMELVIQQQTALPSSQEVMTSSSNAAQLLSMEEMVSILRRAILQYRAQFLTITIEMVSSYGGITPPWSTAFLIITVSLASFWKGAVVTPSPTTS